MRQHKGVTLVELLGAIVIFSIAASIIALTVSFIINANKEIIENGQANTTGTLIIRQIEKKVSNLYITDYTYASNQELTLYSDFEYVYNDELGDIELINHDPRLELNILIVNNELFIDNDSIDLSGFSIHETSRIEMIENTESTQFIITIVLASEKNLYTFKTNLEVFI
jgi:prepilin-type N-terminal cleavage/methylation domain-containing protein